jgi:hypothetical protein
MVQEACRPWRFPLAMHCNSRIFSAVSWKRRASSPYNGQVVKTATRPDQHVEAHQDPRGVCPPLVIDDLVVDNGYTVPAHQTPLPSVRALSAPLLGAKVPIGVAMA